MNLWQGVMEVDIHFNNIYITNVYYMLSLLAIDNLTARIQSNSMNITFDSVNGDQNDEEFEDAD